MNKISFLTVALLLLVSVSCAYPPWGYTPAQIATIKGLMKRVQEPVNKLCKLGWHLQSSMSLSQWGFDSGCVRNDANCGNFDLLKGHCKACKWGSDLMEDATYGNWCSVTWYAWLLFYMALFFGIALLVMAVLAIMSCLRGNKGYKKMDDTQSPERHVEMVSEDSCSYEEENSHVNYNNPYHH
jgi:hypothetical protein